MLQVLTSCRHKVAPKIFQHCHVTPWANWSRRKFAKLTRTWYRLSMGDQTDSQVGSQVHASRKFHAYTDDLRSTCVDYLRWVAKRWKLASTCVRILSSIKIIASRRKRRVAKRNASWTQVEKYLRWLASTCELSVWPGLHITFLLASTAEVM